MSFSSETPGIPETELLQAQQMIQKLETALNAVIFGKENLVQMVLTALLANGHVLLEGLPGLGKTELVKALQKALQLEARRIQFTPDLLPGDITGNPILQEEAGQRVFRFEPGPLFANLVLADEINRASPKTQSALLEAMQEARVTVMGETHLLPQPFFVLATQNPIELEGTYPLPEAQLDRFLFKLEIEGNNVSTLERIILGRRLGEEVAVPVVMSREELRELQQLVGRVYLPPAVANFIARLVDGTHRGTKASEQIKFGASPRAALALVAASRARALIKGRGHAAFEDVRALALPVLQHRLVLDYGARLEGFSSPQVVHQLLGEIPGQALETPPVLSV